jgi:outer membrane protein insertion porin family
MPILPSRTMRKLPLLPLALLSTAAVAGAQESPVAGRCATPDALAFRGSTRTAESALRAEAGIRPATSLSYRDVQRAVKNLFATGQFDDVRATCELSADGARAILVFEVRERPLLGEIEVRGTDRVSSGNVRERIELVVARPVDPAQVARAVARIDSLYESKGYYLARIKVDTTIAGGNAKLTFTIDEGNRLAVSGVRVLGTRAVGPRSVVKSMKTKPEGFLWWRKGEFDEDKYQGDLTERIPQLYASRGFIDMRIVRDTLIVDRARGKALIEIAVEEGPQYRVGSFEPTGSTRFSRDEIARFYPFGRGGMSLGDLPKRILGRSNGGNGGEIFDRARWEEATRNVQQAYANEGYIYASVTPVVERSVRPDSVPVVNLRWDIEERQPAIVNRVEIVGNSTTTESCIREQIFTLPGDVFNQDLLVRSYHNIANLGFFETPLPPPDTRQANERGDVDIVFRVKEKNTGSVHFGASVGQGTGVGGFVGFEQPNLFGLCKKGSLQWQFGRYINDFNLSYTDPAIQQTRISGTVNAYHSQNRFIIAGLGRQIRTGGQLQFGFPVPRSRFSRLFVSYGGERVDYGDDGLLGTADCRNCFRSTLGLTLNHDTRIDMPFPSAGANQSLSAQFTGGPLGGTAAYQRYTGEMRSYATLASFGGGRPGSSAIKVVTGLSSRAGVLFGNAGPFYTQRFSLGGVQFGEPLRGYEEFSITPNGYNPRSEQFQAELGSFGNAFFTTTAEVGLRFGPQLYLNAFYDAGNIWARPRDFDPTRLFRGAGIGASLITPLGPLGLDLGYGFDRRDDRGRLAPGWQLHFRLGQFF